MLRSEQDDETQERLKMTPEAWRDDLEIRAAQHANPPLDIKRLALTAAALWLLFQLER